MSRFTAEARIRSAQAADLLEPIRARLTAQGAACARRGETLILSFAHFPQATARISLGPQEARLRLSAPDAATLEAMRRAVLANLLSFAWTEAPEILWSSPEAAAPPKRDFQILRLIESRDLTPRMRLLTFAGGDLSPYARLDALHLKGFFPDPRLKPPRWPEIGEKGAILWPQGAPRPALRKYTIRAADPEGGRLSIEMVLHPEAGPGADFARHAEPGAEIGAIGPGGGGLAAADWRLFAGDLAALPAISRMAESLPASARGHALIEIEDPADRRDFSAPEEFRVEWLIRPPGAASGLPEALRAIRLPPAAEGRRQVWAGCEDEAFRAIRLYIRTETDLRPEEHLAASYWRRGAAQS